MTDWKLSPGIHPTVDGELSILSAPPPGDRPNELSKRTGGRRFPFYGLLSADFIVLVPISIWLHSESRENYFLMYSSGDCASFGASSVGYRFTHQIQFDYVNDSIGDNFDMAQQLTR